MGPSPGGLLIHTAGRCSLAAAAEGGGQSKEQEQEGEPCRGAGLALTGQALHTLNVAWELGRDSWGGGGLMGLWFASRFHFLLLTQKAIATTPGGLSPTLSLCSPGPPSGAQTPAQSQPRLHSCSGCQCARLHSSSVFLARPRRGLRGLPVTGPLLAAPSLHSPVGQVLTKVLSPRKQGYIQLGHHDSISIC